MKKIMLTGDRPTGKLHIGHYVGSIKQRLSLKNECKSIFIVADLHMLTTKNSKEDIINSKKNARELVRVSLACGLDMDNCTFYLQSLIPELNEIYTLFQSLVGVSRLERIPSLKDMANDADLDMPFALLGYPILQAADILSVKGEVVPVGKDNMAHVEVTREIAIKFNKKYGNVFPVPEAVISKECSSLPGIDGKNKMSKSLGNAIYLDDSIEEIRKKVRKMPTDPARIRSDIPGNVSGNLVFTYHDLFNDNIDEVNDLKDQYQKGTVGDALVKEKLVIALDKLIGPIRESYDKYSDEMIDEILIEGSKKVREIVKSTLEEMKTAMGFYS